MLPIKTTTMLGTTNIAADRITINNNFELVYTVINNMQYYLDTDLKEIKGIEKISLFKGSETVATPNEYLLRTNGSISALGNAAISGAITANTGKFATGLELTTGNFNLPNANTNFNISGNLNVGGELVLTDFNSAATIPAYSQSWYNLSSSTNMLITDGFGVVTGGKISLKGRNSVILDWTLHNYNEPLSALTDVMLLGITGDPTLLVGQVVEIVVLVPDPVGYQFKILGDTLSYPGGPITHILFTQSYQSVRVIFDGNNWVVLNVTGATIV